MDVIALFAEAAEEVEGRPFEGLAASTVIADLGIASVSLMEVIGMLEDDLDVVLPEDQLAQVKTLGDLEALVRRQTS